MKLKKLKNSPVLDCRCRKHDKQQWVARVLPLFHFFGRREEKDEDYALIPYMELTWLEIKKRRYLVPCVSDRVLRTRSTIQQRAACLERGNSQRLMNGFEWSHLALFEEVCMWFVLTMVLRHLVLGYTDLSLDFMSLDSPERMVKIYEFCSIPSTVGLLYLYVHTNQVNILLWKVPSIFGGMIYYQNSTT